MNNEQFDKELSRLYQHRKAQIVAPTITLDNSSNKRNYSKFKLLSIFTVGGLASFGIMAIITHLAPNPEQQQTMFTTQHQIHIADDISTLVDDQEVVIKAKLPPKPETPVLVPGLELLAPVNNDAHASDIENIEIYTVQIVKLPHLKEPEFLLKPVYKVMPKLSYEALQEKQSGAIRLRYEIDSTGNVTHIEVVNSDVSRELQRSAKKALAQWKYNPSDNVQLSYEIIFEFNPVK